MKYKEYIVLRIPADDTSEYQVKATELLSVLKQSNIDIANVLILPDSVDIKCLKLPMKEGTDNDSSV